MESKRQAHDGEFFSIRIIPYQMESNRQAIFFVSKISIFLKNNGFKAKMCRTLKIDLFICYNLCRKYIFPRSIFIDIK